MRDEKKGAGLLVMLVFIVVCLIVSVMDLPMKIFEDIGNIIFGGACIVGVIKFGKYIFRKRK